MRAQKDESCMVGSQGSEHHGAHRHKLTLNLHRVTTTNLRVWSLPRISSLHKMSSWWKRGLH